MRKKSPSMAILWYSSLNKLRNCCSRCCLLFLNSTGPLFVVLALTLISFCAYEYYTFVLPWSSLGNFAWYLNVLFTIYMLICLAFFYLSAVFVSPGNVSKIWAIEELAKNGLEDASIEEMELKAKESENFRFCRKCKIAKPKRAHHCSICNTCVLKMDHHCPWINSCVGHHNHRYFFLFLVYLFIICIYYFAFSTPLFYHEWISKENVDPVNWPSKNTKTFFLFSYLLAGAISLSMSGFCGWNSFLILTAQTTIDYHENTYLKASMRYRGETFVNEYDLGTIRNFKNFFNLNSRYQWWTIFLPLRIPPLGDGTRFPTIYSMFVKTGRSSIDLDEKAIELV